MDRREFLAAGIAAGSAVSPLITSKASAKSIDSSFSGKFKLRYAPSFGSFSKHVGSKDPVDHIKFASDQGFRAMFDNWFIRKPPTQQEAIAKELSNRDMLLGPFIAHAEFKEKTFVSNSSDVRATLKDQMNKAVDVAQRTNSKWTLVVPGAFDTNLEWDYQTNNVIDNLKYCADICAKAKLVIVIEPLNPWKDHPGLFLTKIPQAYMICRAVNSPSCKIVDDIYHQQITEGNLIPNIDKAWDEIAAFHLGDTPGRKEPGTGEINYTNIFKHIHSKEYDGVLCMEHGKSIKGIKGEKAVIQAYRKCDNF